MLFSFLDRVFRRLEIRLRFGQPPYCSCPVSYTHLTLPTKARARFLAGQVVAVNGNVIDYVLPSDSQAQRCEPVRAEVEGAIAQTFGAPLTISLRAGELSPEAPTAAAVAAPEAQHESEIDIHDLTDADGMSSTVVDRIADVFPGAEILDQES